MRIAHRNRSGRTVFTSRTAARVGAALLAAGGLAIGGCPTDSPDEVGDPNDPATIVTANRPPVAAAGDDQTVGSGASVVLDASATSDPDFDRLSFIWRQIAGTPAVSLQNAASSRPQFTAPVVSVATTITFRLTVADGLLTSTDEVSIFVQP